MNSSSFSNLQKKIKKFVSVERNRWYLIAIFAGLNVCLVACLALVIFTSYLPGQKAAQGTGSENQPATAVGGASAAGGSSAPAVPAAIVPPAATPTTPHCDPKLIFETRQYAIQALAPDTNGTFPAPGSDKNVAYQYTGSAVKYVFALSSAPENLVLTQSLPAGTLVTIQSETCEMNSYTLSAPEAGSAYQPAASAQAEDGIVLFVAGMPEGQGVVVRGGLLPPEVIATSTPDPNGPGIEAEIGLLETTTSADKKKINVRISVHNTGPTAFTLNPQDVSLEQEGMLPIAPQGSNPRLPRSIKPNETQEFVFTFLRPSTSTVTIKVFSVEYELEGY